MLRCLIALMIALAFPRTGVAAIVISEVMSSNTHTIAAPDSSFPDWIEIANTGSTPFSLDGYYLSDSPKNTRRWQFPAVVLGPGGYLLVWASDADTTQTDGLHANFALNSDGEELILTGPDGISRLDYVSLPALDDDVSYIRYPFTADAWAVSYTPTPGAANTAPVAKLSPPVFIDAVTGILRPAAVVRDSIVIELRSPDPQAVLYYTLDGSEPDESSARYSTPLTFWNRSLEPNRISLITTTTIPDWPPPKDSVDKGTTIRVRAFRTGSLPSETVTGSYFVGHRFISRTMPLISIVLPDSELFSYETGIYVPGRIYDENYDPTLPFWNQIGNFSESWERQAHVTILSPGSDVWIDQPAGIRIQGAKTRTQAQKSLRLYAEDEDLSRDWFKYPFFPGNSGRGTGKPITRYRRILLRNAGNDWYKCFMKDVLASTIVRNLGIECQAYTPSVVFINGEYWGYHEIRERMDEYYLASHFDLDTDEIAIIEDHWTVDVGVPEDLDYLQTFRDFLEQHDLADSSSYAYACTQMDPENMMRYQMAEIFFANTDWPMQNIGFWRRRTPAGYQPDVPDGLDGRWRHLFFDIDLSMGDGKTIDYTHDTVKLATLIDPDNFRPYWATLFFRSFLTNQGFREQFVTLFADHLNTTFQPSRTVAAIDSIKAIIEPEAYKHIRRWRTHNNTDEWNADVAITREFLAKRPPEVFRHLASNFALAGTAPVTVDVSIPAGGTVKINSILIDTATPGITGEPYPWQGTYFKGLPVTLKAIPQPGYRFAGWEGIAATADSISITLADSLTVTAIFVPTQSDGIEDEQPLTFDLGAPYPNPFNAHVTIPFQIPSPGDATLTVYALSGQLVRSLTSGVFTAGNHTAVWDGRDDTGSSVATGVYIARLEHKNASAVAKLLLIK